MSVCFDHLLPKRKLWISFEDYVMIFWFVKNVFKVHALLMHLLMGVNHVGPWRNRYWREYLLFTYSWHYLAFRWDRSFLLTRLEVLKTCTIECVALSLTARTCKRSFLSLSRTKRSWSEVTMHLMDHCVVRESMCLRGLSFFNGRSAPPDQTTRPLTSAMPRFTTSCCGSEVFSDVAWNISTPSALHVCRTSNSWYPC